jgi:hypothetical protein
MDEAFDIALGFGSITFVMIWCYVDGHVREWKGEGLRREDFDIFKHRE